MQMEAESCPAVNSKRKGKPGRKATWSTDILNDLVDIITSSEYYQRKLIFTNTKTQNNAVIYEKILVDLKKRADGRGVKLPLLPSNRYEQSLNIV